MAVDSLTEIEAQMLDTESEWSVTAGRKEAAIADRFGMSAVRYYQRLNDLLAHPAALAYDPLTVNRLRRITTRGNT